MTIISAKFANVENSVVDVQTEEAGSVLVVLDGPDISGGWRDAYSAWTGETQAYVAPVSRRSVVEHFAAFGFDAIALLNLSDVERKLAAQSIELPPKCAATRAWIDLVQVAYANGYNLPDAPHFFSELLPEIAQLLAQ